jgi:hypothetical protein
MREPRAHVRVYSYSAVGVVEQKDVVNSGVGDRKKRNLRLEVYSTVTTIRAYHMQGPKYQVIYCIGASVASARRSRFLGPLRTRAGSTAHYSMQEQV